MVEIKKVTDPVLIQQIAEEHCIELEPADFVIATVEQGKILQCAVFSYENETGKIKVICGFEGDINLLDGLCRAILNIMDNNGVKVVYLSEKYPELAEFVGFSESKNGFELELEGFFKCGCCHHG